MLTDLKTLHIQIETHLAELEALADSAVPRLEAVAAVRLALTRASRRRTALLEGSIYPLLMDGATPADRARIEALRDSGKQGLMTSIDHIGRWTIAEIGKRWSDYRAASRTMRASMRTRIAEERAVIYPLLAARSDRAA